MAFKIPVSVLVVIHTPDLQILLIERARHPGYWQSVTGSLDAEDEPTAAAAAREVAEETGIDVTAPGHRLRDWQESHWYDIFPEWRARYAPGVTRNLEHVFSLEIPAPRRVILAPQEHIAQRWLPQHEAAGQVFSPTNRAAILRLPRDRRPGPGADPSAGPGADPGAGPGADPSAGPGGGPSPDPGAVPGAGAASGQ